MAAEAARIAAPGIDRTSAWDKNSNSVWCNGGANLDIVPSTNVVAIRRFSQNQLVADTGAAESEPTTLGLRGRVDPNSRKRSQGVAVDSKRSQIHQVGEGAPATLRQKLHQESQPFGALVVQGPNSAPTGGRVGSPENPWKCKGFCLSARRGSDPRPSAWEADALPTELLARTDPQ